MKLGLPQLQKEGQAAAILEERDFDNAVNAEARGKHAEAAILPPRRRLAAILVVNAHRFLVLFFVKVLAFLGT